MLSASCVLGKLNFYTETVSGAFMIIECENCNTRFNVSPEDIGIHGRFVRCSKCEHEWLVELLADEKVLFNRSNDTQDEKIDGKEEADWLTKPIKTAGIMEEVSETGAFMQCLDQSKKKTKKCMSGKGIVLLLLLNILIVCFILFIEKSEFIISKYPQMIKIYHKLGIRSLW